MRRGFSRQDHPLRQLIARLDDAARWMNPVLAAVVIALMLLSFAYAVSLIDWRNLPQNPAATANPSAAAHAAANPGASASAATAAAIAARAN